MRCGQEELRKKGQPQELQRGMCIFGELTQEKNSFFITHQNIHQNENLYLQRRLLIRILMLYFYYQSKSKKYIHRTI